MKPSDKLDLCETLNISHCIKELEEGLKNIATQQTYLMEHQKSIRFETKLNHKQLDKFRVEVREELDKIKNRQEMIKNRQEMILNKQDQIQFTLHGESRYIQSPPIMASPPFTSPTPSTVGVAYSATHEQQSSLADRSEYSSVFDDTDLESIFGLDWLTGGGLPSIASQDTAPTGLPESRQLQPTLAGTPQLQPTLAGTPQQQPTLAGTPQQQPTLAGTPQQQPTLAGTPQQQPTLAGTPSTSATGSGRLGHGTRQVRKRLSSSLVSPTEVLDQNSQYSIADVGKLGRALAVRSLFGDSVLVHSTPKGDSSRGLDVLDPQKLHTLVETIHYHPSFANMSVRDFQEVV